MKRVQLRLDGTIPTPEERPRGGAIGKVERFIAERPWLTCGEIAEAVGEPSSRVSECLNKLKHEGKAQQEEGWGPRNRSLWADTSESRAEARERELRKRKAQHQDRVLSTFAEKARLTADVPDYRPEETIAEDHYAL